MVNKENDPVPFARGEPCPNCGQGAVHSELLVDKFTYSHGEEPVELSATVLLHRCAACGFEFTDGSADDARHGAICNYLGVHPPKAIVALRETYELSRSQFAQLTRLGEASIARWERGELIQNAAYDQFLYLLRFQENVQRLRDHAKPVGSNVNTRGASRFRLLQPSSQMELEQRAFKLFLEPAH